MTEALDNLEVLQQFRLRAIDHIERMKDGINILWATYNKMPVPKNYPNNELFENALFGWCIAVENQFTILKDIAFDREASNSQEPIKNRCVNPADCPREDEDCVNFPDGECLKEGCGSSASSFANEESTEKEQK